MYIENDSCNPEYDKNNSICSAPVDPEGQFTGRWKYLNDFFTDEWTDEDRANIFIEYIHWMPTSNTHSMIINDEINKFKANICLTSGREYLSCDFQLSGQAVPHLLFHFSPVNWRLVPECELKDRIMDWGIVRGLEVYYH